MNTPSDQASSDCVLKVDPETGEYSLEGTSGLAKTLQVIIPVDSTTWTREDANNRMRLSSRLNAFTLLEQVVFGRKGSHPIGSYDTIFVPVLQALINAKLQGVKKIICLCKLTGNAFERKGFPSKLNPSGKKFFARMETFAASIELSHHHGQVHEFVNSLTGLRSMYLKFGHQAIFCYPFLNLRRPQISTLEHLTLSNIRIERSHLESVLDRLPGLKSLNISNIVLEAEPHRDNTTTVTAEWDKSQSNEDIHNVWSLFVSRYAKAVKERGGYCKLSFSGLQIMEVTTSQRFPREIQFKDKEGNIPRRFFSDTDELARSGVQVTTAEENKMDLDWVEPENIEGYILSPHWDKSDWEEQLEAAHNYPMSG